MQRIVCWCAAAVAVVAAEKDFFADAMSVDRPPLPPENDIVHLDNETDGGARARHLWITPIAYDTEAYWSLRSINDITRIHGTWYQDTCAYHVYVSNGRKEEARTRDDFRRGLTTSGWTWFGSYNMFYYKYSSGSTYGVCPRGYYMVWVPDCFVCAGSPDQGVSEEGFQAGATGQLVPEWWGWSLASYSIMPLASYSYYRGWNVGSYIKDSNNKGEVWCSGSAGEVGYVNWPWNLEPYRYSCRVRSGGTSRHWYTCNSPNTWMQIGNSGFYTCAHPESYVNSFFRWCDGDYCTLKHCTSTCGAYKWRHGPCFQADFSCAWQMCDIAQFNMWVTAGWELENPWCESCWDWRIQEAGVADVYQSNWGLTTPQRPHVTTYYAYSPVPGYYKRWKGGEPGPQEFACEGVTGWVNNEPQPVFPMCDPPPATGALTPYPVHGQDSYLWRCAPGFRPPPMPTPTPSPPKPLPASELPAAFEGPAAFTELTKPRRCAEGALTVSGNFSELDAGLGEFTYFKVCHYRNVIMRRLTPATVKRPADVRLGLWREWAYASLNNKLQYGTMRYYQQDKCTSSRDYESQVSFVCSPSGASYVVSARQPNPCTYAIVVAEPEACESMEYVQPPPTPTPTPRVPTAQQLGAPAPPRTSAAFPSGPRSFLPLAGACFTTNGVTVTVEELGDIRADISLCPFGRITIRESGAAAAQLAGYYDSWFVDGQGASSVYGGQLFNGGSLCNSNTYTSTVVKYTCDAALVDTVKVTRGMATADTCKFTIAAASAAACNGGLSATTRRLAEADVAAEQVTGEQQPEAESQATVLEQAARSLLEAANWLLGAVGLQARRTALENAVVVSSTAPVEVHASELPADVQRHLAQLAGGESSGTGSSSSSLPLSSGSTHSAPLHYAEFIRARPELVLDASVQARFEDLKAAIAAIEQSAAVLVSQHYDNNTALRLGTEPAKKGLAASKGLATTAEQHKALREEYTQLARVIKQHEQRVAAAWSSVTREAVEERVQQTASSRQRRLSSLDAQPRVLSAYASGFPSFLFDSEEEADKAWRGYLVSTGALSASAPEAAGLLLAEPVEAAHVELHGRIQLPEHTHSDPAVDLQHLSAASTGDDSGPRELQDVLTTRSKPLPSASSSVMPSYSPSPTSQPSATSSITPTPSLTPSPVVPVPATGPNALFGYLNSSEIMFSYGGYDYLIYPYKTAHQRVTSLSGRINPLARLGIYSGWSMVTEGGAQLYDKQNFDFGDVCPLPTAFGRRRSIRVAYRCGTEAPYAYTLMESPACTFDLAIYSSVFCGIDLRVGRETAPQSIVGPGPYIGPVAWAATMFASTKIAVTDTTIQTDWTPGIKWIYTIRPFHSVQRYNELTRETQMLGWWQGWNTTTLVRPSTGTRQRAYRAIGQYTNGGRCKLDAGRNYTTRVRYVCPTGISTLEAAAEGRVISAYFSDACSAVLAVVARSVCGATPYVGSEKEDVVASIAAPVSFYGPKIFAGLDQQCVFQTVSLDGSSYSLGDAGMFQVSSNLTNAEGATPFQSTAPMTWLVCPYKEIRVYPAPDSPTGPYYSAGLFDHWSTFSGGGTLAFYKAWEYTSGVWCDAGETYYSASVRPMCTLEPYDFISRISLTGPCAVSIHYRTNRACGVNLELGQESVTNDTVRTCPTDYNTEGWNWLVPNSPTDEGAPPITCLCASIPGAHRCVQDPVADGVMGQFPPWMLGATTDDVGVGAWGFTYKVPEDVPWPTPLQGKGSRDGMLVTVKPFLVYRGHEFKWYVDTNRTSGGEGTLWLRTEPSENPYGLQLYFRLILLGYMDDKPQFLPPDYYQVPFEYTARAPAKLKGAALEYYYYNSVSNLWRDATKAAFDTTPTAPVVIAFAQYEWHFRFEMRYEGPDGKSLQQTLTFDPEDGSVPSSILNKQEYHFRRTAVSVDFDWLFKWCPAGTYQVGADCRPCPSAYPGYTGTYNELRFMADHKDSDKPDTRNPLLGPDGICKPERCRECEQLDPATGICSPRPGSCTIFNKCYDAGARKGNAPADQCQRCLPAAANNKWTTAIDAPCDDGDACTWFDSCTGAGGCVGKQDNCLRDLTRVGYNCEVCGKNKCDLTPGFSGCVYNYPDGSKICGCSIDGQCYAHGTRNPTNPCMRCNVQEDASKWTAGPTEACDDGNACTSDDVCMRGKCVGVQYQCPFVEGTGLMRCVASSVCDGKGGCITTPKKAGVLCQNSTDPCIPASYCDGKLGYCPVNPNVVPTVTTGAATLAIRARRVGTEWVHACDLPANTAGVTLRPYSDVFPYGDVGVAFPDCFAVLASNWSVPCGGLAYSAGLQLVQQPSERCSEALGTWSAFTELGSGNYVAFPIPSRRMPDFSLQQPADGDMYRLMLRGRNIMGTFLTICSPAAVVVDTTPPRAGTALMLDTSAAAQTIAGAWTFTNMHSGTTLAASWSGFTESFTSTWGGFLAYRYRLWTAPLTERPPPVIEPVDSNATGDGVFGPAPAPQPVLYLTPMPPPTTGWVTLGGWTKVNYASSISTNGAAQGLFGLPSGMWYQLEVQGFNRAGLSASTVTPPVMIDRTGPVYTQMAVRDGGPVSDFSSPLTLSWDAVFSDPESGISHYEVAWGTRPGFSDILAWTEVPGGVLAISYSLEFAGRWQAGFWYYGTVRAISQSGAITVAPSAPGQLWDVSPPTELEVSAPARSSAASVRVAYRYLELESGFSAVTVWVGTSAGRDDIATARTFTGPAYSAGVDVPLTGTVDQQVVYVTVRITNRARLQSAPAYSGAVTLDGAIPVVPFVRNLRPGQVSSDTSVTFHSGRSLSIQYGTCFNPISGIVSHEVRVTTHGRLVQGGGVATIGNASAIEVVPWSVLPVPDTTAAQLAPTRYADLGFALTVVPGWSYLVTVRCTTGSGRRNQTSAPTPIVADVSGPTVTSIGFGTQPGSGYPATASPSAIEASWLVQDGESGVGQIEWAMGGCSAVNSTLVKKWSSVGTNGTDSLSGIFLQQYVQYCIYVRATNRAGLVTSASSVPLIVDITPPVLVAPVRDGGRFAGAAGADVDFWSAVRTVGVEWSGCFSEPDTNVTYAWCAGSVAGQCDVYPRTEVGNALWASAAVTNNLYSQRIFHSVWATNGAGLTVLSTSNGVVYDDRAPAAGSVKLLDAAMPAVPAPVVEALLADTAAGSTDAYRMAAVRYAYGGVVYLGPSKSPNVMNDTTAPLLRVQLSGFTPNLAPIAAYHLAVGSRTGAADLMAFRSFNAAAVAHVTGYFAAARNISSPNLWLVDGQNYFFSGAGQSASRINTTVTAAAPVVWDASPPTAFNVTLPGSVLSSVVYSSESSKLTVCVTRLQDNHSGIATAYLRVRSCAGITGTSTTECGFLVLNNATQSQQIELLDFAGVPPQRMVDAAFAGMPAASRTVSGPQLCTTVSVSPALPVGVRLVPTVTLVNGAQVTRTVASDLPLIVDPTPPVLPGAAIVTAAWLPETETAYAAVELKVRWQGAVEDETPCCNYTVSVGTTEGAADVGLVQLAAADITTTSLGGAVRYLSSTLYITSLKRDAPLAITLTARNAAGLNSSILATTGTIVHTQAALAIPSPIMLISGRADDGAFVPSATATRPEATLRDSGNLTVLWSAFLSYARPADAPSNSSTMYVSAEHAFYVVTVYVNRATRATVNVGARRRAVFSSLGLRHGDNVTVGLTVYAATQGTTLPANTLAQFNATAVVDLVAPMVANVSLLSTPTPGAAAQRLRFLASTVTNVTFSWTGLTAAAAAGQSVTVEGGLGFSIGRSDALALQPLTPQDVRNGSFSNYSLGVLSGVRLPSLSAGSATRTLYAVIRTTDAGGNSRLTYSEPLVLVSAAPSATGFSAWNTLYKADKPVQTSDTVFTASWTMPGGGTDLAALTRTNSTIVPSGLVGYDVSVSTKPSRTVDIGADPAIFTTARVAASATSATVTLPSAVASGTTVYMLVEAVSTAGFRTLVSSGGLVVDPTTPQGVLILQQPVVGSAESFDARWYFNSLQSGRDLTYTASLSSSSNCTLSDIAAPVDVGSAMSYRWSKLSLRDAVSIFVCVRGCNTQGRCASMTTTAGNATFAALAAPITGQVGLFTSFPFTSVEAELGVSADGSVVSGLGTAVIPPFFAHVAVTPNATEGGINSTALYVAWEPFTAPSRRASLSHYTVVLGEGPGSPSLGACDYVPATARWCTITITEETAPSHGSVLYATVTGFTAAGVAAAAVSQPMTVDLTPPAAFTVTIPPDSQAVQPPFESILCTWTVPEDDESGILMLEIGAGVDVGVADAIPWAIVEDSAIEAGFANLSTSPGTPLPGGEYHCGVRATNRAGVRTEIWSTSVAVVDPTPPLVDSAVVFDGPDPLADARWLPALNTIPDPEGYSGVYMDIWTTWHGFSDPDSSIVTYQVALSSNPNPSAAPDIARWQDSPSKTAHVFTGAYAADGQVIYAMVRAVNSAGLVSSVVVSNGASLDRTPPVIATWALKAQAAAAVAADAAEGLGLPRYAFLFSVNAMKGAEVEDLSEDERDALDSPPLLTIGVPFGESFDTDNHKSCLLSSWGREAMVIRDTAVPIHIYAPSPSASPTPTPSGTPSRTATPSASGEPLLTGWDDDYDPNWSPSPSTTATYRPPSPSPSTYVAPSPKMPAFNGVVYEDASEYEADTNSTVVYDLGIAVSSECAAGYERVMALDVCLPCSLGYYKPTAGDEPCQACPANTGAALLAKQQVFLTAASLVRSVTDNSPGVTACGCIDDSQVFVQGSGCVCAPGYVPNSKLVQASIIAAYRGGAPANNDTAPRMCLPVSGRAYKPQPGDELSLVATCPVNSIPRNDRTTCVCNVDSLEFNATSGGCVCKAGTYLPAGAAPGRCAFCPAGLYKAVPGNAVTLCAPCPWGSKPNYNASTCEADQSVVEGSVFMPATDRRAASIACPPGTTLRASFEVGARTGLLLLPINTAGRALPTVCVEPDNLSPANKDTGVRSLGGVAATVGLSLSPSDIPMLQLLQGQNVSYGKGAYPPTLVSELLTAVRADAIKGYVVVEASCPLPIPAWRATCDACPERRFQPFFMPVASYEQAAGLDGECGACPRLSRGTYFASVNRTLFLDWRGVFDDAGGSGLQSYTVAVGTVIGGSQVVPFFTLSPTVTNITFVNVNVNPSTPIFATVVATDKAGNAAVYEDTRPTFYDPSPPLAGRVIDMDLNEYWFAKLTEEAARLRVNVSGNVTINLAVGGTVDIGDTATTVDTDAQSFLATSKNDTTTGLAETGSTGAEDSGTMYNIVAGDSPVDDLGNPIPATSAASARLLSATYRRVRLLYEAKHGISDGVPEEASPDYLDEEDRNADVLQWLAQWLFDAQKQASEQQNDSAPYVPPPSAAAAAEPEKPVAGVFYGYGSGGASLLVPFKAPTMSQPVMVSQQREGEAADSLPLAAYQPLATEDWEGPPETDADFDADAAAQGVDLLASVRRLQQSSNNGDSLSLLGAVLNASHLPQDVTGTVQYSCNVTGTATAANCGLASSFCRAWRGNTNTSVAQYSMVAVSANHACVITAAGNARCFGNNTRGEAPAAALAGSAAGVSADRFSGTTTSPFRHIAVNAAGCSCGLTESGVINCWGATAAAGCYAVVGGASSTVAAATGVTFRYFSLPPNGGFIMAVTAAATRAVVCYGAGNGCVTPTVTAPVMVTAQDRFSCVLEAGGNVVCLGSSYGGTATTKTGPFSTISSTDGEVCAVYRSSGGGICWQEGGGTRSANSSPATLALPLDTASLFGESSMDQAFTSYSTPRRAYVQQVAGSVNVRSTAADASGVRTDRIVYALDELGMLAAFDAANATVGSCTASSAAMQLCTDRSGLATGTQFGQIGGAFGLRNATSAATSAWASLTCGATCSLSLVCFGSDSLLPAFAPPADLTVPCALRPPQDVADTVLATQARCVPIGAAADIARGQVDPATNTLALPRPDGVCTLSGLWESGSLVLEQSGTTVTVRPAGTPGSATQTAGLRLLPSGSTTAKLTFLPTAAGDYDYATEAGATFDGYQGGRVQMTITQVVAAVNISGPAPANTSSLADRFNARPVDTTNLTAAADSVVTVAVLNGTLSANCSVITWSNGTVWRAARRCGARFVRIGYTGDFTTSVRAPSPYSYRDLVPAANASAGPEVLALADVQVLDASGQNLAASRAVTVKASAANIVTLGASARDPALVLDNSNTTTFVSSSGWAPGAAAPWLLLDLGYEAPVDSIRITRRTNSTSAVEDTAWGWLMAGLRVLGFTGQSAAVTLADAATVPSQVQVLEPVFKFSIRDRASEFRPSRASWSWSGISQTCDFDPAPSASPTPSRTATPSTSVSATPSRTATISATPSVTGTATPSRTPTTSVTSTATASAAAPSATPTVSGSASAPATPTPSSTPVPLEFRTPVAIPTDDEILAGIARMEVPIEVLSSGWRSDVTFKSLESVPDIEWSADVNRTVLAWEPFYDAGSSLSALGYCWGTLPFTCDVVGWTPVSLRPTSQAQRLLVDSAAVSNLALQAGATVYGCVAAVNNVGLVTLVSSNGVMVDNRPPAVDRVLDTGKYFLHPDALPGSGTVMYRPPSDIDCDGAFEGVGASWRDVNTGAGIGSYAWSVGTCPGCADLLAWTDVGKAVAVYNESVRVPPGVLYYASVRATGVTGAVAYGHSDGVRVLSDAEVTDRMVCVNSAAMSGVQSSTSPSQRR